MGLEQYQTRLSIVMAQYLFDDPSGGSEWFVGDNPSEVILSVAKQQLKYGAANNWCFGYDNNALNQNGLLTIYMVTERESRYQVAAVLEELARSLQGKSFGDLPDIKDGQDIVINGITVGKVFWGLEGYTPHEDGWFDFKVKADNVLEFRNNDPAHPRFGLAPLRGEKIYVWEDHSSHWLLDDGSKLYINTSLFPNAPGWQCRKIK